MLYGSGIFGYGLKVKDYIIFSLLCGYMYILYMYTISSVVHVVFLYFHGL